VCAESRECAILHYDCYEIFKKNISADEMETLCRLWLMAVWRNPWKGAQPTFLLNGPPAITAVCYIAEKCGLAQLRWLLLELLYVIYDYSPHCWLWRYASAFELASGVSATPTGSCFMIQLREILAWECNGEVRCATSSLLDGTLRLTIDSRGIKRVESLSSLLVYRRECYNRSAFVAIPRCSVSGVMA